MFFVTYERFFNIWFVTQQFVVTHQHSKVKWNKVKWSEWSEVEWGEVKRSTGKGGGRVFMEKVYRSSKWWEVKDWGESVSELMTGKKNNYKKLYKYSLTWVFLPFVLFPLFFFYFFYLL